MASKPTKIVVYFEDGTQTEIPASGVGSIFLNEPAAIKCGNKPPYRPPPGPGPAPADTAMLSAVSTESTTSQVKETRCYLINGVIVCP
jgi:hypothetical protein